MASSSEKEEKAWREEMVGREIEVEYVDDFYPGRIQSYRIENDMALFNVLYYADGSLERMRLNADFTGSDPSGEEKFVWRFARPTIAPFPSESFPATTTVKRKQEQKERESEAWRRELVGTDVELKSHTAKPREEWIDCHVDKEENGEFTLFLVDEETRERFKLERDGTFTSSTSATLGGTWRKRAKRIMSAEQRQWRESIVNRVIALPFASGGEWLEANVEEDLQTNDLFLIRYLNAESDKPSYERVMLFENMRGADPSGDDEFSWRLLENRAANHDAREERGVIDSTNFAQHLLNETIWVEFDREWFQAKVISVQPAARTLAMRCTLKYLVDSSVERVYLLANFTGKDLAGEEEFKWKL